MSEVDSYIFGLLITDGNLSLYSRNRGRVSLEVSERDRDIVEKLMKLVNGSNAKTRARTTNFTKGIVVNYISFVNYHKEFRNMLINCGFPIKDKTINACTPNTNYDEFSFWRGVIDGDGSIGFTGRGEPFVSLTTYSEFLKVAYLDFIEKNYNIKKNINRNKRDNIYNITIKNENAVLLASDLYKNCNDLCINRKYEKYLLIKEWKR